MATEFDDNLRQRLLAFQEHHGLTGNGVAGAETWNALMGTPTSGGHSDGATGAEYAQVVSGGGQRPAGSGRGGSGQGGSGHSDPPEMLADDPYPGTPDGEQPGLFGMSDEGAEFLARHEGVRLRLYNDSQGHCTIGVGHLVHQGNCNGSESEQFKRGLTHEEAMALFRQDLGRFESAVSNGITSRINQYQFDALVSFCFNIGTGGFAGSGVLRQVNSKHYSRVPAEMMHYVNPPEVAGRRRDEAALFRNGQY